MERIEGLEMSYVHEIVSLIQSRMDGAKLLQELDDYHENDIAEALEYLNEYERKNLYQLLGPERISEIFAFLDDASDYLEEMQIENAVDVLENMDADDAVDVLETIEEETAELLVSMMDEEVREDIELIQSYEEDEIGSMMTTNFIQIQHGATVKQAMKEMVAQAEENDNLYTIYVCDEKGAFYGAMDLKDLITARQHMDLEQFISQAYPFVRDHEKVSDCLEKIRGYAEDSIPVLDDEDHILGVITSQDIIEAVEDEMNDDYAKLAGLTSEEDLNEGLFESMKKRLPWLAILLFLGMGVSTVVGMFEQVVDQIAVIVCFQSLILGMAGNAGTQSLAITIRVLMDEQLRGKDKIRLIWKEIRVGLVNGILLGILSFLFIGGYVYLLKEYDVFFSFAVSGCVAIALILSMLIASMVGTVVPLVLHKLKIDPAVASGPLITTINDLVAVIAYFGLAWLLLIQILGLA